MCACHALDDLSYLLMFAADRWLVLAILVCIIYIKCRYVINVPALRGLIHHRIAILATVPFLATVPYLRLYYRYAIHLAMLVSLAGYKLGKLD